MCPSAPCFREDAGELIGFPAFDLLVVALRSSHLRLVTRPVQTTLEELTYMFGMVRDAEVPLDEASDTSSGPELVRITVGGGSLVQQSLQFAELRGCQPGLDTRTVLGRQTIGVAGHPPPTVERRRGHPQNACHHGGGFSLLHKLYRSLTPSFQLNCGSFRSHTLLYAAYRSMVSFNVLDAVLPAVYSPARGSATCQPKRPEKCKT